MKRVSIYSVIFILISINTLAQNKLKGKVVDANSHAALQGASISFGGKDKATSDVNGMFTLDCHSGEITVSFIGYQSFRQYVKNCNEEISIALIPSSQEMDAVEITATSNLNKSILYQPSSITKLSVSELKRSNGLYMDEAINGNVPGVIMERRAVSSGQQFNIRGYGNGSRGTRGVSSNFDGQGYKVYLNGIPVTDAEGFTTLDDIDYGSVGNVEVTKGPSGTLYGLAIAGVVNMNTIKPENGRTSISQEFMAGNYGLGRYTTQFQMGGDHSSLLVNYGHQKSDGYTVHNASHKDFVNFAGKFQANAKQSVSTYFGYSNSYDQRSGELTIGQFDTLNFSGNIEYIKRNAHVQVYTVRAGVGHTYNFNSHISNTTSLFATAFNNNASSAVSWTDKAATNFGLRSTFDTKFAFKNNSNLSGITGLETQRQNATSLTYNMIDPQGSAHNTLWKLGDPYFIIGTYPSPAPVNPNALTADLYAAESTTSLFSEWTLAMPHDLSITGGIGWSNMKITLDDRFYVLNKPSHYDTTYNGMVSPHIAINKVFSKKFSAYISYNRAFKAPVSSYFFIPYTTALGPNSGIINSHLKPETGDQYEIGTKGELLNSRLIYQLAFFDAIFSNKMTTIAVPNPAATTSLYTYVVNGGKQDDRGMEALVKYTAYQSDNGFFKAVTPFSNLTYSAFKYKNFVFQSAGKTVTMPLKDSVLNFDYSNHDVVGVPKWVANLGVDVTTKPGIYVNFTYFYKDAMPTTSLGTIDGNATGPLAVPYHVSSYSLLNAKIGFQRSLSSRFDLNAYFGINNIANTKYPIMVFINQYPDTYLAGPIKANYFGGINLKYNIK